MCRTLRTRLHNHHAAADIDDVFDIEHVGPTDNDGRTIDDRTTDNDGPTDNHRTTDNDVDNRCTLRWDSLCSHMQRVCVVAKQLRRSLHLSRHRDRCRPLRTRQHRTKLGFDVPMMS